MNLSSLKPADGSVKKSKRIGRGQGSGKGGTSTRGHKGAKSRSGYSRKIGFEGGQMPLYRRVPKFGFKNINRVEYIGINIDVLNDLAVSKNIESFDVEKQIVTVLVDFFGRQTPQELRFDEVEVIKYKRDALFWVLAGWALLCVIYALFKILVKK